MATSEWFYWQGPKLSQMEGEGGGEREMERKRERGRREVGKEGEREKESEREREREKGIAETEELCQPPRYYFDNFHVLISLPHRLAVRHQLTGSRCYATLTASPLPRSSDPDFSRSPLIKLPLWKLVPDH